jgi:hypothetical protein
MSVALENKMPRLPRFTQEGAHPLANQLSLFVLYGGICDIISITTSIHNWGMMINRPLFDESKTSAKMRTTMHTRTQPMDDFKTCMMYTFQAFVTVQ